MIKAKIKAKGVVEKPDVIGALFGQTEGLLGTDLNLRELQRTGRIGRIEVNIKSQKGNSEGEIIIPSALDSAETALIAATLETIERIGPCEADIKLEGVEDTRKEKREFIIDRSKEILQKLMKTNVQSDEISEQIKEDVRKDEVTKYYGMPAGPDVKESEELLVVEGRADIINLLKFGIRHTIAVEGTSVPPELKKLAREKTVTVFVDGDRGGELILKEIMQKMDIDYTARAPEGKEVEELTQKECYKALREKIPASRFNAEKGIKSESKPPASRPGPRTESRPRSFRSSPGYGRSDMRSRGDSRGRPDDRRGRSFDRRDRRPGGRSGGFRSRERDDRPQRRADLSSSEKNLFKKTLDELSGSKSACIFDSSSNMLGKVPVSELSSTLKGIDNPYAVILDGKVDFGLNSLAKMKGVKFLVGTEKESFFSPVAILDRNDLK